MAVAALKDYNFEPLDKVENFHGNQLVYINWIDHLMFCAPVAYPLPPEMPFGALVAEILPMTYNAHPDFGKIDWDAVEWKVDHEAIQPNMEASLKDNGVGHKSVITFVTPGLKGYKDSAS